MKFRLYRKGHGAFELTVLALMVLTAFIFLPCGFCSGKYESARSSACVNNLKQLGLMLNLYAAEKDNHDLYPPIDNIRNNFIFEGNVLYPEYLSDINLIVCPGNKDHQLVCDSRHRSHTNCSDKVKPKFITDHSYCYLGWEITDDEEAEEFFHIYDELSPEDYGKDILDPADGSVKFRVLDNPPISILDCYAALHDTEERKGSSEIPVVWDRPHMNPKELSHRHPDTREPAGLVLYKDGHVEFVKYGEKFPMTETMARLLEERPRGPIPGCEE
jgi:hypothetical protein